MRRADNTEFDPACRLCPRLAELLGRVRTEYPDYHARPVPPFGDPDARLLIVGLAPGMHGANRTGRPFTGDHAGILLYDTLFQQGYSNRPASTHREDGLELRGCRITNAVKCLPPQNKPLGAEITASNRFLRAELDDLPDGAVILALGAVAHRAVLRAEGRKLSDSPFAHAHRHPLSRGRWLLDSYHCSRYNTQTRRLTPAMFQDVFDAARQILRPSAGTP